MSPPSDHKVVAMQKTACLGGLLAFASLAANAVDSPVMHIVGHYSDEQLSQVHTLILPRIFLYDANNHLMPDNKWPLELAGFHRHKFDDEHCCLAYYKTPGGGPPPECAQWMNYDSKGANLAGLMDTNGTKIDLKAIPTHKWLIVDYGANWCAACVVQDKQLAQILASEKHASDYVWITVDMTRVPDVKNAKKASIGQGR